MRSMTASASVRSIFAVEEGPLGEFTGLRLPGSGGKEGGEQGVEDYGEPWQWNSAESSPV